MSDWLLQHKFILVVITLVVVAGVWYGMTPSTPAPLLTTTTVTSSADQSLVETLLALRAVKLQNGIFTEQAFMSLQDFSTPIVPEPVGRPNPFAPLDSMMAPTATTTTSAQLFHPASNTSTVKNSPNRPSGK